MSDPKNCSDVELKAQSLSNTKFSEPVELERDEKGRLLRGGQGLPVGRVRKALSMYLQEMAVTPGADGTDYNPVWDALIERAKRGDVVAMKLYLEYTAGKPVQELEVTARQSVSDMSNEDLVALAEQAGKALVGK